MRTNLVTQKRPVKTVRTELPEDKDRLLEKHLRKNGQKKGWFIRQAILEKMERELEEYEKEGDQHAGC